MKNMKERLRSTAFLVPDGVCRQHPELCPALKSQHCARVAVCQVLGEGLAAEERRHRVGPLGTVAGAGAVATAAATVFGADESQVHERVLWLPARR